MGSFYRVWVVIVVGIGRGLKRFDWFSFIGFGGSFESGGDFVGWFVFWS